MFSEKELEYIGSQRLARLATVSSKGQPDVVPVGFEFDGKDFWVGSGTQDIFLVTKKFKNVDAGNRKVALVLDDLQSVDPWRPRQIKIYGSAEVMQHDGRMGSGKYLRIAPKISWSFGIEAGISDYRNPGASKENWRLKKVHED
jgi:pyridoxamine 5'-phosphate oxidase family protein